MKHLRKFFEGYENRDNTGNYDSIMSASKFGYEICKKVLRLDREDIVNIITDILDTYPDMNFECVMGRSDKKDGDHAMLQIFFYKTNWSSRGGYFSKSDFPGIDDLAEDVIGRFEDLGLHSKFQFNGGSGQRFFIFMVSKYPLENSNI